MAYAGDEHLNAVYVAAYDRKAGFDPTDDLNALAERGLGTDSVVIDFGAGTGTFTVAVASLCRRVIAVDVSPAMTALLRNKIAELELDNVTVIEAGFLSYVHSGDPVDFIFSRNALHQLPDFWKAIALERMASIIRPSGVLLLRDLVFDFEPGQADERIESWLSGAVEDPSAGWTAEELAKHVRSEFSTYSWLLDAMIERAGFEIVEREFRRSAYGTYTCRRRP